MSVRFIIGRAGSGKTRHCLEAVAAAARAAEPAGPRAIMLVPEQAGLQTERALLALPDCPGTTTALVTSFRRLTQQILRDQPRARRRVISPAGRIMVLQQLLRDLAGDMQYLRPSRAMPGLFKRLSAQIEEFVAGRLRPGDLDIATADPALDAKLHDLRLLHAAYIAWLGDDYVDPVFLLDEASAALAQSHWLKDARVWVDGFASFSQQESNLLVELARRSAHMDIALLLDPHDSSLEHYDDCSLFAPIARTRAILTRQLRQAGLAVEPQLILDHTRRWPARPELAHVEQHLFEGAGVWGAAPEHIEIHRSADPRAEIAWVVERIGELVRRPRKPLRYHEIAVVTRRLDDDPALLRAALTAHDIPHFVDRRATLVEHPLHEFVATLLRIITERMSTDSMRRLLKSPLIDIPHDHVEQAENYVLCHDIDGVEAWEQPWHRDPLGAAPFDRHSGDDSLRHRMSDQINTTRATLLGRVAPWIEAIRNDAQSGLEWATRLFAVIENHDVGSQLQSWAEAAEADGQPSDALRHRQAWTGLVALFDDFVQAMDNTHLSFADFAATFEAGLEHIDIGGAPPAIDQLSIGSVERSRHASIRALFIIGMNEGLFPAGRAEQQLLGDNDRARLIELGVALDAPRSACLGDERLLAYIAMTRPSEELFISYRSQDSQGMPLERSPYIVALTRLFPNMPDAAAVVQDALAPLAAISSADDLAEALAGQLAGVPSPVRAVWNGLYDEARQQPELAEVLRRCLGGAAPRERVVLIPSTGATTLRTSVSELQRYAECAFKHFSSYRLRLQPRKKLPMSPLGLGALYHDVLDRFLAALIDDDIPLGSLDNDAISARLAEAITEPLNRTRAMLRPGEVNFLRARLEHDLIAALRAHRDFARIGQCRVAASEQRFGYDADAPPIVLETPAGHTLEIRGRIDRVDLVPTDDGAVGFIFDYKRSRDVRPHYDRIYYGLELQLLVYLAGLDHLATALGVDRIRPGGGFYLPVALDVQRVDHPSEGKSPNLKFRPRGIFHTAALSLLDSGLTSGKSDVYSTNILKNGRISCTGSNDTVPHADFKRLLTHAENRAAEWADGILGGAVEVAPRRLGSNDPCTFCDFRAVCRIDDLPDAPQYMKNVNKDATLEALAARCRRFNRHLTSTPQSPPRAAV